MWNSHVNASSATAEGRLCGARAPPPLFQLAFEAYCCSHASDTEVMKKLRNARASQIGAAFLRGQIYAETSNYMTFLAPFLRSLFPKAKFVHLARHPADVIRSGMRRQWYAGAKLDCHRIVPCARSSVAHRFECWTAFEKTCWLWAETNDFLLRFLNTVGAEAKFFLRFEDLLSHPERTAACLFPWLGVPPPPSQDIRSVLGTKYNEQIRNSFPRYSEWTTREREIARRICGGIASELGYEMD